MSQKNQGINVDKKLSTTEKLAMYYFADVYSNLCYLLFLLVTIALDEKIKLQNRLGLQNKNVVYICMVMYMYTINYY